MRHSPCSDDNGRRRVQEPPGSFRRTNCNSRGPQRQPHAPERSFFVIPTYRLRDVGETVEHYDEHFWRNGHSVRMIVFDDSSPANQEKYYPLLEQTSTHNDLYYVGPREKEQFLAYLNGRLRDKRLEGLVKNLFRPSYGGNRNYTLMYTLGGLMVSADDDMRPYCLMEDSPESLGRRRGLPRQAASRPATTATCRKSFDILAVVPRRAGQAGRPGARTTTSAANCSSTPRWTWRPTPPRAWPGRTRCCSQRGPVPDDAVGEDGADLPLRHQRHRRPRLRGACSSTTSEQIDPGRSQRPLRAGELPPGGDQEELADGLRRGRLRQHLRPAAVLSRPGCASRTTSTGCGSSRTASPPRTSMPRRTTPRATTCATRRPRRSSTRRWPTCSSGRSRPRSRAWTS